MNSPFLVQEPFTQAIGNLLYSLLGQLGFEQPGEILRLLLTLGAIIWIVRTLSGSNSQRRKSNRKSDDWLTQAQERQNNRFEYSAPIHKPKKKNKKWSPTGWYYDEKKQEWVAPDYIRTEANTKWEWDEEKRIWINKNNKK